MLTARFKDVDPLPDDEDLVAAIKSAAPGPSGEDGKYMMGLRNMEGDVYRVITTSVSSEVANITHCLQIRGFTRDAAWGVDRDMGLQTVFDRPVKLKVPNFAPKHHRRRKQR